jgi:hypothetical protein
VVRLSERLLLARDWASVRKSPDVDAYVIAERSAVRIR